MTTPAITTDAFTWMPEERLFVAEASTLSVTARQPDDSFALKSARTGAVQTVNHVRTEIDREGDLVAWHFAPADGSFRLVIYND